MSTVCLPCQSLSSGDPPVPSVAEDHSASSGSADENENWYALVVKPRHEKVVEQILANKGFDTFLPLYCRRHRYGSRRREYLIPLFPGYVFCRVQRRAWAPVLSTPSVIQAAGAGRTPLPVDDTEIESLRIAAASPYPLSPHSYLKAGRKVKITDGPLTGVEGVILKQKGSMRLILSITMMQRSVAIEVDRAEVEVVKEVENALRNA